MSSTTTPHTAEQVTTSPSHWVLSANHWGSRPSSCAHGTTTQPQSNPKEHPAEPALHHLENVERLRLLKHWWTKDSESGKSPNSRLKNSNSERALQLSRRVELEHILQAVEKMDAAQLERYFDSQLSTLGSVQFAEQIGLPLLHEVGRRWSNNEIAIAAEHLLSNALRTLMGVRNLQQPNFASWPTIVFACPTNERHEFGLLFAALVAESAGCKVIYLGSDLPVEEMIHAVKTEPKDGSESVTLPESICTKASAHSKNDCRAMWRSSPEDPKFQAIENIPGVEKIGSLERFCTTHTRLLLPRPAF